MLADQGDDGVVGNLAGAEGIDHQRHRTRDADGVGDLHFALVRQTGGDDVLRHVATGVGGRAVDLGRILARERATAVVGRAAIGVDDDLASGQTAVTMRPTHHEAPGRVYQKAHIALHQLLGQNRLDDELDHRLADLLLAHVRVVLGGHHHGVDRDRLAIDVLDRKLALGVRAQPRQAAVLAHFGLALHDAVRVVDRQRHQAGRFVGGETKHQTLIAGALVERIVAGVVHALRDVRRLAVDGGEHGAALVVETNVGVVVADAADDVLRDFAVIGVGGGGDLARDHHQAGGHQGLARDARLGVFGEDGVEYAVGHLVRHLVGVTFGNGLRRKQKFSHCALLQKQKIPDQPLTCVCGRLRGLDRAGDALAVFLYAGYVPRHRPASCRFNSAVRRIIDPDRRVCKHPGLGAPITPSMLPTLGAVRSRLLLFLARL